MLFTNQVRIDPLSNDDLRDYLRKGESSLYFKRARLLHNEYRCVRTALRGHRLG